MNRIAKAMFLGLTFASSMIMANTIIDATKAEAWPKAVTSNADGTLESKNPRARIATRAGFAVDTKKVYKISGEFRIVGECPAKKIRLFFGFTPYTAQNKPLHTSSVYTLPYSSGNVGKTS